MTEIANPSSIPAPTPSLGLTGAQKRNLGLASLGSLLEFYEFMVFGFFTLVIGNLFFPPTLPEGVKVFQAFALYSLGFLLRPVSGAILGYLGDRYGRKKLFLITVILMAVPTMLIGLLPTYATIGIAAPVLLLILRLIQGVALAGEFAGASVFMTEHVPGSRVGFASSIILGASYIGFFLGAGTGALLAYVLAPGQMEAWGWRIPFVLGGLFGLTSAYLRRRLDETPMFLEIKQAKMEQTGVPIREMFTRYAGPTIFDIGFGVYLGTMIIILYFYMPTLLQTQFGVDRATTFNANAAALLVLALMCPVWGKLADRFGFGPILGIGCLLLAADLIAFFANIDQISRDPGSLIWWWISFSLFMSSAGVIPALCALVFPTQVRFTGFGFAYNLGSIFAAFAPTMIAWLVLSFGKSSVLYYALATCALGLALASWSLTLRFYGREG
ncbi:MFS transporter [Roseiarcaceae bacterium H3SJ34-1]|uniref:MFS transporter n=1 Tax=Terripilifer ovatus TaxID=3032367 RepID=UPI003AB9AB4E|nr:MFS transporter [Roseiarcaceae bacterium H3SJ34-1]